MLGVQEEENCRDIRFGGKKVNVRDGLSLNGGQPDSLMARGNE